MVTRKTSTSGDHIQEELAHGQGYQTRSPTGSVECLGLTFESDEAWREYFLERLREKLKDPEFRKIEGFPLGSDEDILALSDPPFYTACPNPFVGEFVEHYGKPYDPHNDAYHREPFAADVSEGKNDPIYNAHSYHTKVPHKAIMRYILHYTEPGDVVFDGFCGTGMTGVAAQLCADRRVIESLGYQTKEDGTVLDEEGRSLSKVGARRAVLNDLSPAATFIAYNYNTPVDVDEFEREANRILEEVEAECGWMYETLHTDGETRKRINYTVWSSVLACPNCTQELVFLDEALDPKTKRVRDRFPCPHCSVELRKNQCVRLYETYFDPVLEESVERIKRQPVLINYGVGKGKQDKRLDDKDLILVQSIKERSLPESTPTNEIPFMHMTHQRARMDAFGITHVHHFYLPRPAQALGVLWKKVASVSNDSVRNILLFWVEQAVWGSSLLNRYSPSHFSQVNRQLTGVYYVASQHSECSPWYILSGKLNRLVKAFHTLRYASRNTVLSTGTAATLPLPDACVDYIFTDPPFGENIYYADLNFFIESWHRLWTAAEPEAIVDRAKQKGLPEYQELMTRCFEEYHRVLKPGRWMTVVFHNSSNSVWNTIQEALQRAKFVVADVRTLDKQQGSYRQVTSTAVKQDLVISAYKPDDELERRFELEAGTEEGVWDFVGAHLRQLPVFVPRNGAVEVVAERMNYLLFDRMVAFHVQRGVMVPISAAEFYAGLKQRYPERDGMFFAPDQVAEYDRKRVNVRELMELQLFITGEASAIQWLRQELSKKPQTFQELSPEFMKDMGWAKHEKPLELGDLLRENFLRHREGEPIPTQIVSWMKQSARYRPKIAELEAHVGDITATGLQTHDPELIQAAKDRWYVPDPNKAQDLEKLREGALLKEFDTYKTFKGRRLKVFRLEAVRAGFKKAWGERDYTTILDVARKVPETVLQEDPKLLMWYDQALARTENTV